MSDLEEGPSKFQRIATSDVTKGVSIMAMPVLLTIIGWFVSSGVARIEVAVDAHTETLRQDGLLIATMNGKMDVMNEKIDGEIKRDVDDIKQTIKDKSAQRDLQILQLQQRMDQIEGTPHRSLK